MATMTQAAANQVQAGAARIGSQGGSQAVPQTGSNGAGLPTTEGQAVETSLMPAGHVSMAAGVAGGEDARTLPPIPAALGGLPVELSVSVPVRDFRVRKLLAMAPGELIETQWGHGEDLPLGSGDVQLAWTEFEVVDTRLAVRITRLA